MFNIIKFFSIKRINIKEYLNSSMLILLLLTLNISSCGYYRGSVETIDDPSSATTQPSPVTPTTPVDPSDPQPNLNSASKVSTSDFVSGSFSLQTTASKNYKVMSSSGMYKTDLITKTQKGYTIYSTSLGTLISTQGGVGVK